MTRDEQILRDRTIMDGFVTAEPVVISGTRALGKRVQHELAGAAVQALDSRLFAFDAEAPPHALRRSAPTKVARTRSQKNRRKCFLLAHSSMSTRQPLGYPY